MVFEGAKPAETVLTESIASRLGAMLSIEPPGNRGLCVLSLESVSWHRPSLLGSQLTSSLDVQRSNVQTVSPGMVNLWGLTKALP